MDQRILDVHYGWENEHASSWLYFPRLNKIIIFDDWAVGSEVKITYKLNDVHYIEIFLPYYTGQFPSFILSNPVANKGMLFDPLGRCVSATQR
jgi:hypothetical protein